MKRVIGGSLLMVLGFACVPLSAQIDLAGEWAPRFHEDQPERIPGPDIGDYLGLPITAAARMRADSWDASLLTLPEHQCKPHPSDYGMRGPANTRIWKEVDTATQETDRLAHAYLLAGARADHLDGRPSASAGLCRAHLAGFFDRQDGRRHVDHHHGPFEERLDPPQRHSAQREGYGNRAHHPPRQLPDVDGDRQRSGVSDGAFYPHHRFQSWTRAGRSRLIHAKQWSKWSSPWAWCRIICREQPIPRLSSATRYQAALSSHPRRRRDHVSGIHAEDEERAGRSNTNQSKKYRLHEIVHFRRCGLCAHRRSRFGLGVCNAQQQRTSKAEEHVLFVQGNVYMLVGAGGNIAVQAGKDGVLVVDTGSLACARRCWPRSASSPTNHSLYHQHARAWRSHRREREVAKAGRTIAGGNVVGNVGESSGEGAAVIAHENVLNRMSAPPASGRPTPVRRLPHRYLLRR